jgi:hypothetical protein
MPWNLVSSSDSAAGSNPFWGNVASALRSFDVGARAWTQEAKTSDVSVPMHSSRMQGPLHALKVV